MYQAQVWTYIYSMTTGDWKVTWLHQFQMVCACYLTMKVSNSHGFLTRSSSQQWLPIAIIIATNRIPSLSLVLAHPHQMPITNQCWCFSLCVCAWLTNHPRNCNGDGLLAPKWKVIIIRMPTPPPKNTSNSFSHNCMAWFHLHLHTMPVASFSMVQETGSSTGGICNQSKALPSIAMEKALYHLSVYLLSAKWILPAVA